MRPWFLLCMLPGMMSIGFAANVISANSPLPPDKDRSVIQAQNASGQGQTTIVDEGGSLKIVDMDKKPSQANADAAANSSTLNGAPVLPPGASNLPTQNSGTQNTNMPAKTNSPATPSLSPNMSSSSSPNVQANTQAPSQLKSTDNMAKPNVTNANPLPAETGNTQSPTPQSEIRNGFEQMKITPEQWKEIDEMVKAKIKMFQEENQRKSNS